MFCVSCVRDSVDDALEGAWVCVCVCVLSVHML